MAADTGRGAGWIAARRTVKQDIGVGGQQRAAIAVTIIGGQSLCLFLTLLLVPVAYVKLEVLEQASTTQRIRAWVGHAVASTVGRLRPARREA